ncbi:MAG: hypothetical protein GY795_30030 [Desulfobacterales bacterium]|nr:hypothetical protein [Desulfobacterales bacterium]
MLEPCALKGARTVLRGLGAGNPVFFHHTGLKKKLQLISQVLKKTDMKKNFHKELKKARVW